MNLAQLNYFRTLAKYEHYGKAAERLYITQPSLSNSINNLEKEIGVPLFERVGRNVRLTEYGAEFNSHVCIALDEIDKAVEIMRAYKSGLKGRIRIGAVISIQRSYLASLLNAFKEAFGNEVIFDIYQGTTYECLKNLDEGKLDVAFCGKVLGYKGIEFDLKLTQRLVVAVNDQNPLSEQEELSLIDLKDAGATSYRQGSYIGSLVKDFYTEQEITPEEGFNDEVSALALVTADKTVAAIMLETIDDFAASNVVTIPIKDLEKPFHGIYFTYKKDAFHSRLVEEFIKFAAEYEGTSETELIEDDYSETVKGRNL